MTERVPPRDRLLAEELMRTWNACHESGRMLSEPSFAAFNAAVTAMLTSLGMEWDVGHGYVFPWTDRVNGPFPMTGAKVPKCSKTSLSTDHTWKLVGLIQDSHLHIRVVYACEACSSWTYHEMDFVGFRMSTAQDRFDEAKDSQAGSSERR